MPTAGIDVEPTLIAEALARLSDEHLALIRRSYYDRWTTAEIADHLQIPDGAVKSRLHDAARELLAALHDTGNGGAQPFFGR